METMSIDTTENASPGGNSMKKHVPAATVIDAAAAIVRSKAIFCSALAATITAAFGTQSASSQEQPTTQPYGALEEIVVTAQKRAEDVQDVPLTVSVASGVLLNSRDIFDSSQLPNISSNLQLQGVNSQA